jgi:transcriptional regulator with XRE-family HTH domain
VKILSRVRRTINDDFGSLVRRLRESKGYSTQRLAELACIDPGYLNRIENGKKKRPSIIVIEDLADALGVETNVLLSTGSNRRHKETITLEQLLYSNDFSIHDVNPVSTVVKELLLNLIDTIYDADWEKETILNDSQKMLKVVNQLKEEL